MFSNLIRRFFVDDVTLNPGAGGAIVATDEISGVHHQRVKIQYGDDGSATDVSVTNQLPVRLPDTGDLATLIEQQTQSNYLSELADAVQGGLYQVQILESVLPDGAATENTQLANNDCLNTLKDAIYTEDAAAAANPVGTSVNLIRQDTPAGLTTTDGDNVAQRGTNFGAGFVQVLTSAGAFVDTFGGGQQYSDGDVEADPTGTVAMGTDGSNVFALHTDTSGDLQVDVLTLPALPSGTNNIGDVDVLTLPSIPAGTNNIGDVDIASIAAGDNNIGNVDVVTLPSIPAGNNNIGDVDIASIAAGDNNIGNVDIVTMPSVDINSLPNEGQQTMANSISVAIASNQSAVPVSGTVSVTGVATETTLASLLTSSQLIDDTVVTMGTDTYTEATSKGLNITAVRRDADTTLVGTTNEFGPLQMDANGRLKVEVFSGETLPVSLTSTTITGTVAVTDNSGSLTVDAPVGTPVNVQIGNATLSAGVIDETGASAVDALAVGGGTAHDAVDSGNPLKLGAKAIAHGSNPSAVAAADRTNIYANRAGIPFMLGGHPNIISAEYNTTGAQTDDDILGAIGSGTIIVVTGICVMASNANSVNTSVRIGFGTSTLTASGASGATAVSKIILSHPNIAAGSGVVKGNGGGIVGIGGDGEELRITCSAPTSGSLFVQIDYFTIES